MGPLDPIFANQTQDADQLAVFRAGAKDAVLLQPGNQFIQRLAEFFLVAGAEGSGRIEQRLEP